jgi:hypothetical protein
MMARGLLVPETTPPTIRITTLSERRGSERGNLGGSCEADDLTWHLPCGTLWRWRKHGYHQRSPCPTTGYPINYPYQTLLG